MSDGTGAGLDRDLAATGRFPGLTTSSAEVPARIVRQAATTVDAADASPYPRALWASTVQV